jgi:hypothetical protein
MTTMRYDDDSSSDEVDNTLNGMKNGVKEVTIEGGKKQKRTKSSRVAGAEGNGEVATPEDDDSESEGELVEPGMACDLKNLYSGKEVRKQVA